MHSFATLQQKVEAAIRSLEFPQEPAELYDPIAYTMNLGGKRIRPMLVLMACDLFGGDIESCVNPAVAIEMFHNFTLLHDDIMDQAPLRRGKETVYKKWNTNVAILSGDTMFAVACEFLSGADKDLLPELLKVFTQTAREVCEGQQYDMNFEARTDVSIAEYIEMIRLKTAVLLGCSLRMGAILAHAPEEDAARICSLGISMGLGFQLQDDLLDTFGSAEKFGKEIGGDIVTNKKTFLYLKACELADKDDRAKLDQYFSSTSISPSEKVRKVKEIFSRLRVDEKTQEQVDSCYADALKYLEEIRVDAGRKEVLGSLIKQVQDRRF